MKTVVFEVDINDNGKSDAQVFEEAIKIIKLTDIKPAFIINNMNTYNQTISTMMEEDDIFFPDDLE